MAVTQNEAEDHRFLALVAVLVLTAGVVAGVFVSWFLSIKTDTKISDLGILLAAAVSPFLSLITIAFRDYFQSKE